MDRWGPTIGLPVGNEFLDTADQEIAYSSRTDDRRRPYLPIGLGVGVSRVERHSERVYKQSER